MFTIISDRISDQNQYNVIYFEEFMWSSYMISMRMSDMVRSMFAGNPNKMEVCIPISTVVNHVYSTMNELDSILKDFVSANTGQIPSNSLSYTQFMDIWGTKNKQLLEGKYNHG